MMQWTKRAVLVIIFTMQWTFSVCILKQVGAMETAEGNSIAAATRISLSLSDQASAVVMLLTYS